MPGTPYVLDPVQAAFNIGCMNRWLDFNDTFLGKEWGHPSDNLAAVLAVAGIENRKSRIQGVRLIATNRIRKQEKLGTRKARVDHARRVGGAREGLRNPRSPFSRELFQSRWS